MISPSNRVRVLLDNCQALALLAGDLLVLEQQLGVPLNRREGSPQLVRDHRDELGLQPVRLLNGQVLLLELVVFPAQLLLLEPPFVRPFQRFGHLVEGAGELAQLPLPLRKPGAHAQLPCGDSLRRSDERLDLAHDEQVSTHPGRGEREASDEPQRRKIAGKNPVGAGKGDSRRDANAHVCVRALRSAAERRERKEARDAVFAPSLGRAVALVEPE